MWLRGQIGRQNETVFGENSYFYSPGMKKFAFFIVFLLFTGVNSVVVSLAISDDHQCINLPLGDGEESPGEENKNFSEEDDDDSGIEHRWISKNKSSNSDLHFLYQEILFNELKTEVVVPPPKA